MKTRRAVRSGPRHPRRRPLRGLDPASHPGPPSVVDGRRGAVARLGELLEDGPPHGPRRGRAVRDDPAAAFRRNVRAPFARRGTRRTTSALWAASAPSRPSMSAKGMPMSRVDVVLVHVTSADPPQPAKSAPSSVPVVESVVAAEDESAIAPRLEDPVMKAEPDRARDPDRAGSARAGLQSGPQVVEDRRHAELRTASVPRRCRVERRRRERTKAMPTSASTSDTRFRARSIRYRAPQPRRTNRMPSWPHGCRALRPGYLVAATIADIVDTLTVPKAGYTPVPTMSSTSAGTGKGRPPGDRRRGTRRSVDRSPFARSARAGKSAQLGGAARHHLPASPTFASGLILRSRRSRIVVRDFRPREELRHERRRSYRQTVSTLAARSEARSDVPRKSGASRRHLQGMRKTERQDQHNGATTTPATYSQALRSRQATGSGRCGHHRVARPRSCSSPACLRSTSPCATPPPTCRAESTGDLNAPFAAVNTLILVLSRSPRRPASPPSASQPYRTGSFPGSSQVGHVVEWFFLLLPRARAPSPCPGPGGRNTPTLVAEWDCRSAQTRTRRPSA